MGTMNNPNEVTGMRVGICLELHVQHGVAYPTFNGECVSKEG
jgi:hypothetical protein